MSLVTFQDVEKEYRPRRGRPYVAVREFRLKYGFAWRVINQGGDDIAAPGEVQIERDYSFNDNQVLAKESEEALLYRDMQTDMVQQVMRRLAAVPPGGAPAAPAGAGAAKPVK